VTDDTTVTDGPLSREELRRLDAYWRAANYLSVGQIYLLDNPLLREPLAIEHVKPRLLGHWGTTPGLNFVYAHLNRVIRERELSVLYVAGPGHGGPGIVANVYLEGTYSEVYPHIGNDVEGIRRLFRQFSFPGGIPSHVAPETPGSIHEGGELGYSLLHAYGAAFDNPELLVCCVIGDGEAETGALAASWHSNKFLDPVHDGAVMPVLHLNGYKIANPTVLARIPHEELRALLEGYGYAPRFVEGDDPEAMHQLMAATLDEVTEEIAEIQRKARQNGDPAGREGSGSHPRWPMIVLRSPKGWTGPKIVDGLAAEGSFRSHQVRCQTSPATPNTSRSSSSGCAPTAPRSCSTITARCAPTWRHLLPNVSGGWAPARTPTAVCCCASWSCPTSVTTQSRCRPPQQPSASRHACSATSCAT
jgi:xylulose-5-phosphate/fructose-6-phosphate phosphoketolase